MQKMTTGLSIKDGVQQSPMPVIQYINCGSSLFLFYLNLAHYMQINFGFFTVHVHELLWDNKKQFSICKTCFGWGIQNVVWNHCNLSFCSSSDACTTCGVRLHISRLHAHNPLLAYVVFFFTFFTKDFQGKERLLAV